MASARRRRWRNPNARPIALPRVRSFDQLFEAWAPWRGREAAIPPIRLPAMDTTRTGRQRAAYMDVGPYFHAGPISLAVRASVLTVDAIRRGTISIAYDSISFEAIVWDLDSALVVGGHSRIIGGVWLAVIDPLTIPGLFPREAADLIERGRREYDGDMLMVASDLLEEAELEELARKTRKDARRLYQLARRRARRRPPSPEARASALARQRARRSRRP